MTPTPVTVVRVRHRVSGQHGRLITCGTWYSAVIFDGETYASTVATDSLTSMPKGTHR